MTSLVRLFLATLLGALTGVILVGSSRLVRELEAADPPPPAVYCEAIAPFRAMVAAEVLWHHHNPPNDPRAPFWGMYIPPREISAGERATIRAEGHPAFATIAFTEIGLGGRYQEVHCGQHPSIVFRDGFETGGAGAWSSVEGATGKSR